MGYLKGAWARLVEALTLAFLGEKYLKRPERAPIDPKNIKPEDLIFRA